MKYCYKLFPFIQINFQPIILKDQQHQSIPVVQPPFNNSLERKSKRECVYWQNYLGKRTITSTERSHFSALDHNYIQKNQLSFNNYIYNMNNIKKYFEEQLTYTTGYTQVLLKQDNRLLWVVVEVIAQLHKLGVVVMNSVIHRIILTKFSLHDVPPYGKYEPVIRTFRALIPTALILETADFSIVILIQAALTVLLLAPIVTNIVQLSSEKKSYSDIKYRTSVVEDQESLNYSINILNRSYNMHNYIEHFLQKQFMSTDNGEFNDRQRSLKARILNLFPHVLITPTLYWNLIIWLFVVKNEDQISDLQLPFMFLLNIITSICGTFLWFFSMVSQKSLTINDPNHLRLKQSLWFNVSQLIKTVPPMVQLIYFSTVQTPNFQSLDLIVGSIIIALLVGDLVDNFISYPFVTQYKQNTILIIQPLCIVLAGTYLANLNTSSMLLTAIISVPIVSKFLLEVQQSLNLRILTGSLFPERHKQAQPVKTKTTILLEEQPFVIERELNVQKQLQVEFLENQSFSFFVQYLRLVEMLGVGTEQSIERGQASENLLKSKFLISVIILLKSHIVRCENTYCYCKGFRGERRRILEKNGHQLQMKIFDDIDKDNILISVELIQRYLRYYSKLVFEIEKSRKSVNLSKISQLINFMSDSEECYQTLLMIMELKALRSLDNNLYDQAILTYMTSFTKYQILYRMQFNVKVDEMEATLQYKDYRVTEQRRDKIIDAIFKNLNAKIEFMKNLTTTQYDYESFQQLITRQLEINSRTQDIIKNFEDFSSSRTSLLLYMLYNFEVTNDFNAFQQQSNVLKTKKFKFFEFPECVKKNNVGYEVCYIKANLARHAKKGRISRGEIIDYSNNTPKLFGYQPREFAENVLTIHQLVTHHLATIHDQLLEIFLLTNRPGLLRKRRPLLVLRKNQDLMFAEMFVDLCFSVVSETFPVYCFLRKITSSGSYEYIKGHIILNSELRIEGISTMALEEFKLKDSLRFIGKKMVKFAPNFQRYQDKLQIQYNKFRNDESKKKQLGSVFTQFDYKQAELLLNHFSLQAENFVFRIPRSQAGLDVFIIDCTITMTVGDVHQNEYKSYTIQMTKVNQVDLTSHSVFLSQMDLDSELYRDITDEQDLASESDKELEVQDEKMANEASIHMDAYQLKSNAQSLVLDSGVDNLLIGGGQGNQTHNYSYNNFGEIQQATNQQQEFYEGSRKRQSQVDNEEQAILLQEKNQNEEDFQLKTATSSVQNQQISNILTKSNLFAKFMRKSYNPRLLLLLIVIDVALFGLFLSTNHVVYDNFRTALRQNKDILGILQAFVTTDFTLNTQLGIGVAFNDRDPKFYDQIAYFLKVNSINYVEEYQRYLVEFTVKDTLSGLRIYYKDGNDNYSQNYSAWSELFVISLFHNGLQSFDGNLTIAENSQFFSSLMGLVGIFELHQSAYAEMTQNFQRIIAQNFDNVTNSQLFTTVIIIGIQFLLIVLYYVVYAQYFKLNNRILRTSEQISFKSIQTEQVRCYLLVNHYPNPFELDIYAYQFSLRDKLVQNSTLTILSANRISVRFNESLQLDQKKNIMIKDNMILRQQTFFLISAVGALLSLLYFAIIYVQNGQQIRSLSDSFERFNDHIIYSELFASSLLAHNVIQYKGELNLTFQNSTIQFYREFLEKNLIQLNFYGTKLAYNNNDGGLELLMKLAENVCADIDDGFDCDDLIDGKLLSGILYSSQYFQQKIAEAVASTDTEYKLSNAELLALYRLIKAIKRIISELRVTIIGYVDDLLEIRFISFFAFNTLSLTYSCLISFCIQKYLRRRLFVGRQLPKVLPPQAIYGEDSYMKSLLFITKIYDNLFQ